MTDKLIIGEVLKPQGIRGELKVKPFTDEYKGIEEFKNKKIFMFSDIQKLIAVLGALFFFAVFVSEISPIIIKIFSKILGLLGIVKCGI